MWGHITIRQISNRIPTMCFGLAGDVWTTAGINKAQLWLHVDHLSVADSPRLEANSLPTYGFTVEALETCESIADVAALLRRIDREDGMILVVVDGKSDLGAVFECSCSDFAESHFDSEYLVRTNHALVIPDGTTNEDDRPLNTRRRYRRLDNLLSKRYSQGGNGPSKAELIGFLADDEVERRGKDFATAYSVVACPALKNIWYTLGGYPAASAGRWQTVKWAW